MTSIHTTALNANAIEANPTTAPGDWASLAGRIALAALFLLSALGKLANPQANVGYMQAYGMPAADILIWPAALLEIVAGVMLAIGWKARWGALALIAFTVPATLIFHAWWGVPADQLLNQQIHFMKNLAIVGGLLSVIAHGPGRLALER